MKRLLSVLTLVGSILLAPSLYSQTTTPEICNNGLDDDGDQLIDCFDPDCGGDTSCATAWTNVQPCGNPPPVGNGPLAVQEKWRTDTSLYDVFSTQTPVVGDIDNDGIPEVIACDHNGQESSVSTAGTGDTLFIFDGLTGGIEGYLDLSSTGINASRINTAGIVIGNLDNDPFSEILVLLDNTSFARFEHTGGAPTWQSTPVSTMTGFSIHPQPNIADFDGDGNAEIYAGPYVWNGQTGIAIGNVGFSIPSIAVGAPVSSAGALIPLGMSVAADVLPDSFCADCQGLEIVCGFQVFSVNVATGAIQIVVTSGPPSGLSNPVDGFTAVADYDHDGDLDGVIGGNRQMGGGASNEVIVYAWDLQTPTVLSTSPNMISTMFQTIGQPTVADFDGDGRLEVGVTSGHNFTVLDDFLSNMNLLWQDSTSDESGFTGSTAFDFDGDGDFEIVYQDEDSLYIYDGGSGARTFSVFCRSSTLMDKPLVVDIDGDSEAEIVSACSENPNSPMPPSNATNFTLPRLHGYIAVYESAGAPWAPARNVWNQPSYHVTNINDDLTVPIQQQPHHLAANGAFNGFNLQASVYDSLGNVIFPNCNAAPVAENDTFQIPKNSPGVALPVLQNDIDPDGDTLTLSSITAPLNGTIVTSQDTFTYTPNPGFVGLDSFAYAICDTAFCDTAWVLINVFFLDTVPPTALCANDTLYLDSTGVAILSPGDLDGGSTDDCGLDSMWVSQDTFTALDLGSNAVDLIVQDVGNNLATCQANVLVLDTFPPPNTAPLAVNDTFQLPKNSPSTGLAVLNNDVDPEGDVLSISILTSPSHGVATVIGDSIFYQPDPGFVGMDSLVYIACDSFLCDTAHVLIDVQLVDTVPPFADCMPDTLYLDANGIAVLQPSDIDAGSFDDCGIDSMWVSQDTFTALDLDSNAVDLIVQDFGNNLATCQANVLVLDTFPPPNTAPLAVNDTFQLPKNSPSTGLAVLNNDVDPEGDVLSISILTSPSHGVATVIGDSIFYQPDPGFVGMDSLVYIACDSFLCDTAHVLIDVQLVDTVPPFADCMPDTLYLDANGIAVLQPSDIDAGSFDDCGIDSMWVSQDTFTALDLGSNAVDLIVQDVGNNLATCQANVLVLDTFPPPNTAPLAVNDTFQLPKNSPSTGLAVLNNDVDPEGDVLSISILTSPSHGVATVIGDSIFYQPDPGFVGMDSLVYIACDSFLCDTAHVLIDVQLVDTVPPFADCMPDTLYLDANGIAVLQPSDIDAGSFDDCGIDSMWVSQDTFTALDLGSNAVDLIVQDVGNNLDTCQGMVEVVDTFSVAVTEGWTGGILVYPNPSAGFLNLKADQSDVYFKQVKVVDPLGRSVMECDLADQQMVKINISTLAAGAYWLGINTSLGTVWRRFERLE